MEWWSRRSCRLIGRDRAAHGAEMRGEVGPQAGFQDHQCHPPAAALRVVEERDDKHADEPEPGGDEMEAVLGVRIVFQVMDVTAEHDQEYF